MKIIFVGGLDQNLVKVAAALIRKGVPVMCFLDRFDEPTKKTSIFDTVMNVDANRFRHPETIYHLNDGVTESLSADVLRRFTRWETLALTLGDRYGVDTSVTERKAMYHELLLYFYRFLRDSDYRLIIFPAVPHDVWNLVLYAVAKHFGIATLIIEETLINDRVLVLDSFEEREKVPAAFLSSLSSEEVLQELDGQIRDELTLASANIREAYQNNRSALTVPGPAARTWVFLQRLAMAVAGRLRQRVARQPAARDRSTTVLPHNQPGVEIAMATRRYTVGLKYSRLYHYYENRCAPLDEAQPYVYFCLHHEPEKKITPMGGVFDDQVMAVQLLSRNVPAGWHVYVREHPLQFNGSIDSQYYRSQAFYDRLVALPNVRLMSVHEDPKRLLQHARVTASIGGSVGWEGLMQGKGAFVFGMPWYVPCRSCYHIDSSEACREAFRDLLSKTPETIKGDLLRFIAYAGNRLILGTNSYRVSSRSQRTVEELAASLAEGLALVIRDMLAETDEDAHNQIYAAPVAQVPA